MHDLPPENPAHRARVSRVAVSCDTERPRFRNVDEAAEEASGCVLVAVLAQHRIDELAVSIYRPVEVTPAPSDLHVGLVDVPGAADATPPLRTEPLGEQRCEGRFPRADRLVCHLVAALEEYLGDVAEAQLVAQPPEHREHHDVGREPDLVEARAGSLVEPAPGTCGTGTCGTRALCAAAGGTLLSIGSADRSQGSSSLSPARGYPSAPSDLTEPLEPLRQGLRAHHGGYGPGVAAGLSLRHDHGSQYLSDHFQGELRFLGIRSSPSFVAAPEGNGCAERFIRTLKEQLLWVEPFETVQQLRLALLAFKDRYNQKWLVERHGHRTPAAVRQAPRRAPERLHDYRERSVQETRSGTPGSRRSSLRCGHRRRTPSRSVWWERSGANVSTI